MMGMTNPETVHYGMWDGSSIVICAYVLTLILITVKRKEYPHVFILLVPTAVIILALLYCPGIYGHMPYQDNNDHRQVFRRIRWALMFLPVLSFGLTYLLINMRKIQRALVVATFVLLFIVSVFYTSDGNEEYGFWDRSNAQDHIYKVPYLVINIGDIIMNNSGEYLAEDRYNRVNLLVSDDGKGKWEKSMQYLAYQLRLYVSPIHLFIKQVPETEYTKDSFKLSQIINEPIDYILCPDDAVLIQKYEKDGYIIEWHDGEYCLMCND